MQVKSISEQNSQGNNINFGTKFRVHWNKSLLSQKKTAEYKKMVTWIFGEDDTNVVDIFIKNNKNVHANACINGFKMNNIKPFCETSIHELIYRIVDVYESHFHIPNDSKNYKGGRILKIHGGNKTLLPKEEEKEFQDMAKWIFGENNNNHIDIFITPDEEVSANASINGLKMDNIKPIDTSWTVCEQMHDLIYNIKNHYENRVTLPFRKEPIYLRPGLYLSNYPNFSEQAF